MKKRKNWILACCVLIVSLIQMSCSNNSEAMLNNSNSKGQTNESYSDKNEISNPKIGNQPAAEKSESVSNKSAEVPFFVFSDGRSYVIDFENMRFAKLVSDNINEDYIIGRSQLFFTETKKSYHVIPLDECYVSESIIQYDGKLLRFCEDEERNTILEIYKIDDMSHIETINYGNYTGSNKYLDPSNALLSPFQDVILLSGSPSCARFLSVNDFQEIYPDECLAAGEPLPSPDNKFVVFKPSGQTMYLGQWIRGGFSFLEEFKANTAAFSSEGKFLVYFWFGEILLMDYSSKDVIARFEIEAAGLEDVYYLTLSPEGDFVIISGSVEVNGENNYKLVFYDFQNMEIVRSLDMRENSYIPIGLIKYLPGSIRENWTWFGLDEWQSIIE